MEHIKQFPDFPTRVVVELTNKCNLNCDYCPRHHLTMKEGFMSPELFKSILNQCHEHGCDVIPFWRGEMFLHPDVIELLTYAVYSVPHVYIATNGTQEELFTMPINTFDRITSISLSAHSSTAERIILELNNKRECETPHLQVTVVEQTEDEWITDSFDFKFLRDSDTIRKYKQHSRNGKWGQTANHVDEPNRTNICSRLMTDLVIAWDGSISECCYVWPTYSGNSTNANHQTLKELWTGHTLTTIRENYPTQICLNCDQWKGGGKTL